MEHQEMRLSHMIGIRVKELRGRNGLTAKQLADKLVQEGVPWERGTVTKLETKRRDNVTVTELLALAKVLNVAPVHLLVPLEDERLMQVTPEKTAPSDRVRAWVRGETPLAGTVLRTFRTEVPLSELRQDPKIARFGGRHGDEGLRELFEEHGEIEREQETGITRGVLRGRADEGGEDGDGS